MAKDHDDHDHDHRPRQPHSARWQARVKALETILVEKGLIDPPRSMPSSRPMRPRSGPRNGAQVVAKAWSDPAFAEWLQRDATAAIASARLSAAGRASICARSSIRATLTTSSSARSAPAIPGRCWACRRSGTRRAPYRSRAVIDPRGVLAEFGADACRQRRRSASGTRPHELRYIVVPERPGRDGGRRTRRALAELVSPRCR